MRDRFAWVCGCAVLVIAGCSLERLALGGDGPPIDAGPGIDGGRIDGGRVDGGGDGGGPACTPGGCDDGNVCTNDTCDPGSGCVFSPVPGACDDGILCNGADSCMDGACSVHDMVNPCPGSSICDPGTDACTGCAGPADCPAEMFGDFGACSFDAGDVCATGGTRTRMVTSYTCVAGTCQAADRTESEACSRSTDGVICGAVTADPWSLCGGYSSPCDDTGTQTRVVRTPVCGGGACSTGSTMETQACTRVTEGMACGGGGCDAWSLCYTETACQGTGWRFRGCDESACTGGSCMPRRRTESEVCMPTNGSQCVASSTCDACHDPGSSSCTGTYGVTQCTYTIGTCNPGGACMSPSGPLTSTIPCRCGP